MKYAPGRPVYCPALVSSPAAVNRRAGGDSAVHQTPTPPRCPPNILPHTAPTPASPLPPYIHIHTQRHTHSPCFSTNTRPTSSLRSDRGGSDELLQKSYSCFSLTGDSFKPSLSLFMFFLSFLSLSRVSQNSKLVEVCKLSAQQLSFHVLLTFFENKIYTKLQNQVLLCRLYVCLFCYIGVSTERTVI